MDTEGAEVAVSARAHLPLPPPPSSVHVADMPARGGRGVTIGQTAEP